MKVVKNKITGRLVHRTIPDFKDGEGIRSALTFYDYPESELEETTCTPAEWEAEIELRKPENLPHSEHIGKLIAVNPAQAKPATVRRRFRGENYDVNCLVTQSVAELFHDGKIEINDFVLVSFIEEMPNETEKNIAIVTDKVYESW